jgi:hypothetical protein
MAYPRLLVGGGLVVALSLITPPVSDAAFPDGQRPAIVRVSVAALPPPPDSGRQRLRMMRETEAIWRPYGVVLVWIAPWTTDSDAPADASLRVTFSPRAHLVVDAAGKREATALGAIRFFDGDRPEDVMALSADDVEAAVLTTRWFGVPPGRLPPAVLDEMTGRALGRVLAHELGHYLLAVRTHAAAGLMRPLYSGAELAGWDRRGFRLDASALDRLRARLGALTATRSTERGATR